MHPAFMWWWKHARRSERDGIDVHPEGFCGPGGDDEGRRGRHRGHFRHGPPPPGPFGHGPPPPPGFHEGDGRGGDFGVRRPLRFLANKLDLSEAQTADLARILDALKTERAQAEVDQRRAIAAFADAIENATFGDARAAEGGEQRVESAKKLRDAVVKALGEIHALLNEDQRKRFAYLVRTGVLVI
jgi:Spy/CpxP family protein refolding chaperone